MTQAPDTLFDDLLDRVLAIALDTDGIQGGTKRVFELPRAPYPRVQVFYGPITFDYAQGSDIALHIATLYIRLLGGPLASGGPGELEDSLNRLLMAVMNRFHRDRFLCDPATGEAFDYLVHDPPPRFTRTGGTVGFMYGNPANPDRYFGHEFTFEVRLITPRK